MKNRASDDGRGPRRSAVQMTGRTNPAGTETIRAMLVQFDGTHDGSYAGLPATGRRFTLQMVAVVTFDHAGKVVAEQVYLEPSQLRDALTI